MSIRPKMGLNQRYIDAWTPVVDEPLARVIQRVTRLEAVYTLGVFAFAAAAGFGFAASVPLGLALVALSAVCFALRIRQGVLMAEALSEYFGTPIRWSELPMLTPDAFARACQRNGWSKSSGQHLPGPAG